MSEAEIAEYIHKIITNPNMNVPVAECRAVVECQDWLLTKFDEKKEDKADAD